MRRPILLDVMGTLVHDPFYREIPAFFDLSLEALLEAKHPDTWREFELGEIDEPACMTRFFRDGRAFDVAGLKALVSDSYQFLEGIELLLGELCTRGQELHVLSNYSPWYHLIENRLQLSRFAPWTFVSCDTGVRKPSLEAYLGPARRLGVEPADLLLIDDREVNCQAATSVGLDAIRFSDAAQLRDELEGRRIL